MQFFLWGHQTCDLLVVRHAKHETLALLRFISLTGTTSILTYTIASLALTDDSRTCALLRNTPGLFLVCLQTFVQTQGLTVEELLFM